VPTEYEVTAINDTDSMVGFISSEMVVFEGPPIFTEPYTHAVVWPGGNFGGTDLGPVGLERSGANAISASGQIVGASTFAGEMHAALWTGGAIVDLGTLGGAASTATALNAAGQIVGDSLTTDATTHAFIWESGTMRDLGTLGGANAVAVAINSRGQVTGSSNTASGVIHAFIWEAGTMRDLGTLGGAASIAGPSGQSDLVPASQSLSADWVSGLVRGQHMINDAGQIAGTSLNAAGQTHAFLWEAGTMRDLGATGGTFSEAVGHQCVRPSGGKQRRESGRGVRVRSRHLTVRCPAITDRLGSQEPVEADRGRC
jgi:probable HAF family extracellular repeat protein